MPDRQMSVREYANHRGVGDRAVVVALQKGRISRTEAGWIDPVQADIDWEKNTNPRSSAANKRNGQIGQAMRRARLGLAPKQPESKPSEKAPIEPISFPSAQEDMEKLTRARAVRERYAALSIKLDYEERSGKLIDRKEVESTAQMHGRILQEQLLAIPDRLAAQLAAESDAATVHTMLDAELRLVLEKVSAIRRVMRRDSYGTPAAANG